MISPCNKNRSLSHIKNLKGILKKFQWKKADLFTFLRYPIGVKKEKDVAHMARKQWSKRQKKILVIGGVMVFLALMLVTAWCIGRPMLKLAGDTDAFRKWLDTKGWYGWILFVLMLVVQVFAAVIPGEPLELAAGYVFGAMRGTILCLLGEAIGGILVFLFVKRFGMQVVETFFPMEKIRSLRFLHGSKKRDALLALLFFLPGTPKDLLCYFAGLTDISLVRWCLIQTVGRLPSILTSTLGGHALGTSQYAAAVIILVATACVSGGGLWLYHRISQKRNAEQPHTNEKTDTGA